MVAEVMFTIAIVCIAAPVLAVIPAAFIGFFRWRGRKQERAALPAHRPAHSHA